MRFAPGQRWEYSNTGYFVFAEVIRRVSGRPWSEVVQERIFRPAGMSASRTTMPEPVAGEAVGYGGDDNKTRATQWRALRPSGAFLSTVLDLAKWDAMLDTGKVLTEASRAAMWTPVRLTDGTMAPYGFGWRVEAVVPGHPGVHHGGALPGFTSEFVRFLDDRVSVIVLMNAEDVDRDAIVRGIAGLYLTKAP